MNRVAWTWDGLEELREQLRQLPAALVEEGSGIVERRATEAFDTIYAGYPSRSADLRNKLTVTHSHDLVSAKSVLMNTSNHAVPFDVGSAVRETTSGANRGSMPANPIFTVSVRRARRAMYDDFAALLTRLGLRVTTDA